MGNNTSKTTIIRNALQAVQKSLNESIISLNSKCKAEGTTENVLMNVAKGNEFNARTIEKCLDMGNSPLECREFMASAYMRNVTQQAMVQVAATCEISQSMVNDIQAQMSNNLTMQMKQMNDDFGKALNSLVSAFNVSGENDETTSITNEMAFVNEIVNRMTLEVMQEAVSTASATNRMTNSAEGLALVEAEGILMDATSAVLINALSKSESLSKAVASMQNEAKTEVTVQNKGLTDLADSVLGGISKVIGTATVGPAIACVVALFVLGIGAFVFLKLMGGSSNSGSSGGGMTLADMRALASAARG